MTELQLKPKARRFRLYPEYKDSGVEWLGKIPVHWDIAPLKRRFRVVNGATPKSGEPDYWDGDIVWVTPDDLGSLSSPILGDSARKITHEGHLSCGTTLVPAGSLVLSTRAPIGHLAMTAVDFCTNQGCRSLLFRRPGSERFSYYQMTGAKRELQSWGQGSTFKELAKNKLEAIPLAEPPANEQRTIATFLDRETAKIDALVAKKERLIELLEEKRTALITYAVTKGLDPDVPMRDPSVESFGKVPSHWEVGSLVRWWQVIDCKHRTVPFLDEGVPVASIGEVHGLDLDLSHANRTSVEEYQQMIEGGRK
ncbi:MAG: restriction endonuclease subunit S, partial [Chloroflexi bacterium]|nr:restriction endonuclease subunit S [Chloroflexota bacterium]